MVDEDIPRLAGVLLGNLVRQPAARTKYALFFEAVARCFPLVEVFDATLVGWPRFLNALQVVHPNWHEWRARFHQNVPAFVARSKRTVAHLRSLRGRVDVVLQAGVLFDSAWEGALLPNIIYTDYTAALASLKPAVGRSPFSEQQRAEWIALEKQAFRRAAHICTRSRLVRESVIQDSDIALERVSVIGGGVNLPRLPILVEKPPGTTPTVLFIGKNFYRKGGDLMLQAFARVREEVWDARLLLLTADPIPSDLPRAGVDWVRPTWNRSEIEALYRQADVFVLPSRLETWGDVLLEAMAYGLPCIGVSGQAMEEIIKDGETGIVVPAEDVAALSKALSTLLTRPGIARQFGCMGRKRVEQQYTWDRISERLAPVIYHVWRERQHEMIYESGRRAFAADV
jgi:glycosyltransferase involved in cell wall biosynthesis